MKWASMISYLPIDYSATLAKLSDFTQRVTFVSNLTGDRIRIRFSNKYSKHPLELSRVTIGKIREEVDGGTKRAVEVTRGQKTGILLNPGEECYSDEIAFPVLAGDHLAVSVYVKEEQLIGSVCALWSGTGAKVYLGENGDYTDGRAFAETPAEDIYEVVHNDPNKGMVYFGFSGVQVLTSKKAKTIAAFGDSITHMSYLTNAVSQRLCSEYPGQATLLNCGIGGNRLLRDATYIKDMPDGGHCFGEAGLKRFETDVFRGEQVDIILFLEGINDIMHPIQFSYPDQAVTAQALIDGYRQIAACAHQHGAKVYCGTVLPCGNPEYPKWWMKAFEEIRNELNEWIRKNPDFDGYFDYDRVLADEQKPDYMKPQYHIGDGLHPNDEGGVRMAAEIDFDEIMKE
ncbi:MAG: GDSL-type esterase/lipase family protein [Clostridiales bacterium]|nr:GDSL-type esterase/lipase family protein [Clostridiales bacterium]